jgi:excisionase family DNA binding protein
MLSCNACINASYAEHNWHKGTAAAVLVAREAAELLGVSRMTIYRQVRQGSQPAIRLGHSIRIPTRPLVSTLQRSRTGPAEERVL